MQICRNGRELKGAFDTIGDHLTDDIATQVLVKLTLDGFRELVRRTPVDTGFLRSRWAVTTYAVPEHTTKNPGGNHGYPAQPNTGRIKFGDKVTIYNNTEYAEFIEHGTPVMRAQPMVAPTEMYLAGLAERLASHLSIKDQ